MLKEYFRVYGKYPEIDPPREAFTSFENAEKYIKEERTYAKQKIKFWSDGLVLKKNVYFNPKGENSLFNIQDWSWSYRMFNKYFENSSDFLNAQRDGDSDSTEYLVKSLRNDPSVGKYYEIDELKKILDSGAFKDNEKKSILAMAKLNKYGQ